MYLLECAVLYAWFWSDPPPTVSSARTGSSPLSWHAECFSNFLTVAPVKGTHVLFMKCVHARPTSCVRVFVSLWTVARQAPPSMGFSQARTLEWVAISLPRESSWPRNWTCVFCVSCIGRRVLRRWAAWEGCTAYWCTLKNGWNGEF